MGMGMAQDMRPRRATQGRRERAKLAGRREWADKMRPGNELTRRVASPSCRGWARGSGWAGLGYEMQTSAVCVTWAGLSLSQIHLRAAGGFWCGVTSVGC